MAKNHKKLPLRVTKKMLERWTRQAQESVEKAHKEGKVKRDPPPGMDPDDEHEYIMRPFC
jgi:hypothetical protein